MTPPTGPNPADLAATWPVGAVAAAWSTSVGSVTTLGDINREFKLASVTKPLVAHAILIAIEEGTLSLNQPAGPPGSTIELLLGHASGLGPRTQDPVVEPGTRRIYSNAGFDVLGAELERAAGMTIANYLREAVCEPLGMNDTWLNGSPAFAAVSTVSDLTRFCREWLQPTLLHPTTADRALSPLLPNLEGVLPGFGRQIPNPWGLGFELRGTKSPHWIAPSSPPSVAGHFGAAGTFIWIDRQSNRFAVCLTDTDFGPWAAAAWPPFNEAILAT